MTALDAEKPRYNTAAYCMMAGYILKTICHGLLWFYVSTSATCSVLADDVDVEGEQGPRQEVRPRRSRQVCRRWYAR